jgi:hypothetical protein
MKAAREGVILHMVGTPKKNRIVLSLLMRLLGQEKFNYLKHLLDHKKNITLRFSPLIYSEKSLVDTGPVSR